MCFVVLFAWCFFDFVSSGKSERNIDVVLLLGQFRPDSSTATGPREQRLAHVMDALLFEVKISWRAGRFEQDTHGRIARYIQKGPHQGLGAAIGGEETDEEIARGCHGNGVVAGLDYVGGGGRLSRGIVA